MKVSRFMFPVVSASMSLFVAIQALPQQDGWGWFHASSVGSDWSIVQGKANVSISPSSFSAQLRTNNSFLMATLKGTVSDRKVVARATFHGTDKPSATLTGRLRRFCWDAGGGREILVLTDEMEVISIARDLKKGQKCLPEK